MTAYFVLSGQDPTPNVVFDLADSVSRLDCADPLKRVILKSLARDPDQRYQTAGQFAKALGEALEKRKLRKPGSKSQQPIERTPANEQDVNHPVPASTSIVPAVESTSIGLRLRLIPAGEFLMGSPDSDEMARDNEKPQHQVRITRPFYMGIQPVTQEEYEAITGQTPSHYKGQGRPVESVTWFDAVAFCNQLSLREDLPEYYDVNGREVTIKGGVGFRLPTEAEWEYACRAGTTSRWYCGDNVEQLGDIAWLNQQWEKGTIPVGSKQPNPWGLYDMLGNVWEWCWDWFSGNYYSTSPTSDPMGPDEGDRRVLRGGSFYDNASGVRGAYRLDNFPANRYLPYGFRVARTLPPEPPYILYPLSLTHTPPQAARGS